MEEWRARHTVSYAQQLQNELFGNSIYTKRMPIGDMDIVKNCSQQLVRSFYDRWYQPQNQAVVIVGDIDPDEMVKKVQRLFGDRKRGNTVFPTPVAIPDNEIPKALLFADKKQPYGGIGLIMRLHDDTTVQHNTVGSMKTDILRDKIKELMGKKLSSLNTKYQDIFDGSVSTMDLADLSDKLWIFNLSAPQDQWQRTCELMAKQVELIRRKGFAEDSWKDTHIYVDPEYNADSTAIVMADTSFTKTSNAEQSTKYVNQFAANFFKNEPLVSDMARQLARRHIMNHFTGEELREEFCRMTSGRNMLIGRHHSQPEGTQRQHQRGNVVQRHKSSVHEAEDRA
jgi:hypothetical protein